MNHTIDIAQTPIGKTAAEPLAVSRSRRWNGFAGVAQRLRSDLHRVVALSILASMSVPALADPLDTSVSLFIGNVADSKTASANGASSSTANLSYIGGTAAGSADLASGTLSGASHTPANGASVNIESDSNTDFYDYATITSATSGIGYLDYRLDASVSPKQPEYFSGVFLDLSVGSTGYGVALQEDSAGCDDVSTSFFKPYSCTVGTSLATTGSIPFMISAGTTYIQIDEELDLYAEGASATSTGLALFDFRLPDGATYTSESGVLFDAATPLASVPEPGAPALLLLGLAAMALVGRRALRGRRFSPTVPVAAGGMSMA